MADFKLERFSVKYIRTRDNNWVAYLKEDELKDFAVQNLINISILNLAAAIKQWMDCGVVGEFYTVAALNYYSRIERVRNYLGKKGNRYIDQVRKKYLIEKNGVLELEGYSLTLN